MSPAVIFLVLALLVGTGMSSNRVTWSVQFAPSSMAKARSSETLAEALVVQFNSLHRRSRDVGQDAATVGGAVASFVDTFTIHLDDQMADDFESFLLENQEVVWFQKERAVQRFPRTFTVPDPLYSAQWHLHNVGQSGGHVGNDIKVVNVWSQGINGTGVVIAVVDDGLEHSHPDIQANYVAEASYDFNGKDPDPSPGSSNDYHGTRCAGEISAVMNHVCGIGVAFNSGIAGVRLISAAVDDATEASALNYGMQVTDIYSNSWGPSDRGATVEGPGTLLQRAFDEGVTNGRHGLGSIYVFASGNGARFDDECNYDGYANSRFTMAIGAVQEDGTRASYSEGCAHLFGVTYSSGTSSSITTTDAKGSCTSQHSGTSAAAPLAAGLMALALSIRPDLTWRDMQHIVVQSATPIDTSDATWSTNFSGRRYSRNYGFGLLTGERIIAVARNWTSVGGSAEQFTYQSRGISSRIVMSKESPTQVSFVVTDSHTIPLKVEWVTVTITIDHPQRGALSFVLTSPSQTSILLAAKRRQDNSKDGFNQWTFSAAHFWGEASIGTWTLDIHDASSASQVGYLLYYQMSLYGSNDRDAPVPASQTMDAATIAVVVAGVLVVLGGIGVAIYVCRRNRRRPIESDPMDTGALPLVEDDEISLSF